MAIDPNGAIANKVIAVIRDSLFIYGAPIERDTRLIEDLDIDSLDLIEAFSDLEADFGVEFPADAAAQFRTVGNVVAFLRSRTGPTTH